MTEPGKALRLRVFAGPNGSGKSTVIRSVRQMAPNGYHIDFGVYINADDIAQQLRSGQFSFEPFQISPIDLGTLSTIANHSGLLSGNLDQIQFEKAIRLEKQRLLMNDLQFVEAIAQILADFLRKVLLDQRRKISFETVFSHPSKIDYMRLASEEGYKIYLYFVGTLSPQIKPLSSANTFWKRGAQRSRRQNREPLLSINGSFI